MTAICPSSAALLAEGFHRELHVEVRDLPAVVQRALESVNYHRRDIGLRAETTSDVSVGGGDGYRGFATMVDLAAGRFQTSWGSWGGANMFNPHNAVDLDRTQKPMPVGLVLIKGHIGGTERSTYAWLTVHPETMAPLLPDQTAAPALSADEHQALAIVKGIKGGNYRREEWDRVRLPGRYSGSHPLIVSLAAKGLVNVNSVGAVSVTTAGRNACQQRPGERL